ncbi:hypothetical protein JY462_11035 [Serratia marcescens]|nr:hypothetical protein [Serratia marcescens]
MDKLSELSKPVAYKFDHGVMGPGDFKYGTPQMHSTAKDENASPLYSQEYVSALRADAAKWFDAFKKAVSVGARYEERIAELEKRLELVREQRDSELRTNAILEKRLATPVRLQSPWVDKVGNRWLLEGTTADVIRAAGFKIEGED